MQCATDRNRVMFIWYVCEVNVGVVWCVCWWCCMMVRVLVLYGRCFECARKTEKLHFQRILADSERKRFVLVHDAKIARNGNYAIQKIMDVY